MRDFLALHYHANARDEPFWRERRAASLPPGAAEKVRQFTGGGRIFRSGEELFTEVAWLQVMVGQGIAASSWSPLAEGLTPAELATHLQRVAAAAAERSSDLPSHGDFVAQHCRMAAG